MRGQSLKWPRIFLHLVAAPESLEVGISKWQHGRKECHWEICHLHTFYIKLRINDPYQKIIFIRLVLQGADEKYGGGLNPSALSSIIVLVVCFILKAYANFAFCSIIWLY